MSAACHGTSATEIPVGSGETALETYRDGCDADTCGPRPSPTQRCVGGYATSVCTKARGACGWQIDCADKPPPEYDGDIPVSSCAVQECGRVSAYDAKDCVYGFIGEPKCERYGSASCAWSRRCRPQPCDQTRSCNVLDRSKLGAACGLKTPCPSGSRCASINVNSGEFVSPTCIEGNGCGALMCAAGLRCYVEASNPAQLGCGRW